MKRDLKWKVWGIFVLTALAIIFAIIPQYSPAMKELFFKGQDPIRKGLDLKGGIEVILTPDYRVESRVLSGVRSQLLKSIASLGVDEPSVRFIGQADNNRFDGLSLKFNTKEELERVLRAEAISRKLTWSLGVETKELRAQTKISETSPEMLQVFITEDPANFPDDALYQAKVIIANRINSSGLSETDVRLDEKNGRIQVQLPGVKNREEAEKLIRSTGRLNFRLNGQIAMFGTDLKDAQATFDTSEGAPVIHFKFGRVGAKQFEEITTKNVGSVLAMYLDEEKLMEPVIKEPIPNGEGRITLGRGASLEEAKNYAILMKSGALPISLRTVQTTQVAPTLGSEMVRQSVMAGLIGIALVVLFMLLFYGIPGLLADVALVIYALLILGVLALFRGVLTLPGVAGFILSIGMAVDANIIIFERIKDELRAGKRMRPALNAGFDRAFWTIFDSNVTTLLVAIVLLIFGMGPVRGFAVTLSIGIIASMFTALVVSRTLLEIMIDRNPDRYLKFFGARGSIR